ncbi:MAG: hypothetical protein J4F31_01665 [Flavobacteriales bacterium]|nr:hypothetical protein [Flavobacteriales bacterium]
MNDNKGGEQMGGLKNQANTTGFTYYVLPKSPLEQTLRAVLETMSRALHV